MRRLLAVFPDHPFPLDMGNRVRNLRILEALATEFDLTIVTLVHDRSRLDDPGPIASLGRWVPVLASHREGPAAALSWHLRARWSRWRDGLHPETFFQSLPVLARTVERVLLEVRPAVVHVAYWYSLRRLPVFPRPPFWIVDTHDVQYQRHARILDHRSPREAAAEIVQLERFDRIIAITSEDAATLGGVLPTGPPIEVIPMGLELAAWDPVGVRPALEDARRVGFYGNLSTPVNQRAARELISTILPSVRRRQPRTEALLLGASPPGDLSARDGIDGVRVPGYVADVKPWLRSMSVLALPLAGGSGQRGRVLEALALGVPVVAYREAVEGLDLRGAGIAVVADREGMVDELVRLLGAPDERARRGVAGRAEVGLRYGWEATYGRFPRLYRAWSEDTTDVGGTNERGR